MSLHGRIHAAGPLAALLASFATLAPAQTITQPITLDLAPNQPRLVQIPVPDGHAEVLTIHQTAGSIQVDWPAHDPRANPAGIASTLRLTLTAPTELSLRSLSPTKPATILITPGPIHTTTPQDLQQSQAEAALAHAEAIRTQRTTAAYPEALRSYDAAIALWRTLDDKPDLARALVWKSAFLFINQSDAAAALPLAEEAKTYLPVLEPVEAANCLKNSGFIHVQLARYDAGRADYTTALHLYEDLHDLFNQEVLFDNRSRLERLLGNTEAALADAYKADALAQQVGDAKRQAKIKSGIGAINLTASHLQAAYVAYQGALDLLRQSPDPLTEGYVWSDLGVLYTLLHEFDHARDALDQSSRIWSQNPNPTGEMNTLDDLGELAMNEGKLPLARTFYRRGLALAIQQNQPRPRIFLLRGLGATYLLENDLPHARETLEEALKLATDANEGDGMPELFCLLGDLHTRSHQDAEAEHFYLLAGRKSSSAEDPYAEVRATGSLARLQFQRGDLESAAQSSERALAGIEAMRSDIPEQQLRTSFFSSMHAYYDLSIQILEELDRRHPGAGYQWQAFLTAERARARMLLDQVSRQPGPQPSHSHETSPALLAEYQEAEAALRTQQKRLAASSSRSPELRAAIARLTLRRDALAAESAASHSSTEAPLTLQSVQSLLPGKHSALLEYWIGQRASYLWAITSTGLLCLRLPPSSAIEAASRSYVKSLFAVANNDPNLSAEQRAALLPIAEKHSTALGASLLGVILPSSALPAHLEAVLVVADGPLLAVPFSALLKTRNPGDDSANLLSEPSATFLRHLLANPAGSPRPPTIAIFASGASSGSAPELPFVAAEARSIQAAFGPEHARIFSGTAATPNAIRGFSWDEYTIGHFASHATLNRQNMQLTAMVLNPANDPTRRIHSESDDVSMLWYDDICRLHAGLDLVVLSACDSANGQEVPGEGLVGLSQAFFIAGAQRVLAALWPVDDEATSTMMRLFYTALHTTHSPATALRMAQTRMAASGPWQSPYYWSGFTLAGDWRALP
jgi:CHAT domain-containing protein